MEKIFPSKYDQEASRHCHPIDFKVKINNGAMEGYVILNKRLMNQGNIIILIYTTNSGTSNFIKSIIII